MFKPGEPSGLLARDEAFLARLTRLDHWQKLGIHHLGAELGVPGLTIEKFFRANPALASQRPVRRPSRLARSQA
jgi:hypothetical protein